jgi:hypothetical protein
MTAPHSGFAVASRTLLVTIQSMLTPRPVTKIGLVVAGFSAAVALAWGATHLRQSLNAADPSQGMQAFGDLVLGVAVFSTFATVPGGLALYWLRPVTRFWRVLVAIALVSSATGLVALLLSGPLRSGLGNWALLGDIRFALLPVTSLAWAMCVLFAPAARLRWIFLATAFTDGLLFAGVVLVKFFLPSH